MKTAITVGVVGFPNVGKSSIINSLKRTQAVSVQTAPCITKVMQEIELDKHVKLLDCPGIVVSTSGDTVAPATLRNFINVHELSDSTAPGALCFLLYSSAT
jgi:nuclear GTP-binding protein